MTNTQTPRTDIRKHLNWKVALASGVIIGAGFGAVSLVQADQRVVETPAAIELRAEQRYPGGLNYGSAMAGGGLSADSVGASVASAASPASPASAKSVASPNSPASAKSAPKPKVAPAPAPVQLDSVDSPASPASVNSPASVDSPDSIDS